jgi:hypothetical protein
MGFLAALFRRNATKSTQTLADERDQLIQRLHRPDWQFFEEHLQRPVPPALKRLFANALLVEHSGRPLMFGEIHVTAFEPIDREATVDAQEWLGLEVVPIASSDGDLIYLRPGASHSDAVYITYHDGGDTEVLAEDAEAFVSALEKAHVDAI